MAIAAVADLLFSSKIRSAARQAGVPITFVRTMETLREELRRQRPSLVIVDLDRSGFDPIEIVREVRAAPGWNGVPIVAFGAHVNVDALRAARDAGADQALPRSSFVVVLPDLLARAGDASDASGLSGL